MTDLITIPTLQVVFPSTFPVDHLAGSNSDLIPLNEVLREGDDVVSISDPDLLERAALYFDVSPGDFSRLQVTRPETGNIIISAKFEYGGTR